jgi:hypothetical protein
MHRFVLFESTTRGRFIDFRPRAGWGASELAATTEIRLWQGSNCLWVKICGKWMSLRPANILAHRRPVVREKLKRL